jgi:hypothetical protein
VVGLGRREAGIGGRKRICLSWFVVVAGCSFRWGKDNVLKIFVRWGSCNVRNSDRYEDEETKVSIKCSLCRDKPKKTRGTSWCRHCLYKRRSLWSSLGHLLCSKVFFACDDVFFSNDDGRAASCHTVLGLGCGLAGH